MAHMPALSIRFRDHPPGLFYIFFAEMWERFSFYGFRALLVFYITSQFSYSQEKAYGIYGTYAALVYTTPIIGGLIADRILGDRKAIILGGIMIALGHICLFMVGETLFYIGLAFIISGTGLFKANLASLLGKLYPHGDHRRDAGFTLYYVGINLGGFLSPIICGYVGEVYGWHYGFSLAALGMIAGLVFFIRGLSSLEGHGLQPKVAISRRLPLFDLNGEQMSYILAFLSVPLVAVLVHQHKYFDYILPLAGVGVVSYMLYLSISAVGDERKKILTLLALMFFTMCFDALAEQVGSSVTFFTKLHVDRVFWGHELPASMFQSMNPLFIILFGPVIAQVWVKLGKREPYTPFKFFLGLFAAALGFWLLALSCGFADTMARVSIWWLVFIYLLYALGELCINPVGLAMVTKFAPPHMTGTLMGVWFISFSFGDYLSGVLAKLSALDPGIISAEASLATFTSAFSTVAYLGFGSALLLLIISPFLAGVFKREEEMKGYNE